MKRKLLLLALVFALVVPSVASLVSCSRQGGGGQESAVGSDTDAETEGSPYLDNLPDDLNFNDAEIRFVYPEANVADIFTEDTGGELVAAAVYRTQMTVEDRLGVVYQINPLPYIRDQYTNQIRTSFSANENAYDIVGEMIGYAGGTVGMGAYADLNGTKYIDFSKPYWNRLMAENFVVDGHLYFCSGDAGVSYLRNINCMLLNTKVAKNFNLDVDFQQLALDGGWTAETMKSYALQASSIADPTNVNRETDTVGLIVPERDHATPLSVSLGVYMFSPDGNGGYEHTYGNAHAVDVIQWMVHLFNDNPACQGTFYPNTADTLTIDRAMFTSDRALLITAAFDDTTTIYKEMSGDYVVLPFPKWDEDGEYATFSRATHITNAIMRTSDRIDMASAVLECLASVGYALVTPAYYEESLKIKYSDATPETKAIFDLIHDSVAFDWGYYCQMAFAGSSHISVYGPILDNDYGWAGEVDARKKALTRGFDSYIEKLAHLEEQYS